MRLEDLVLWADFPPPPHSFRPSALRYFGRLSLAVGKRCESLAWVTTLFGGKSDIPPRNRHEDLSVCTRRYTEGSAPTQPIRLSTLNVAHGRCNS